MKKTISIISLFYLSFCFCTSSNSIITNFENQISDKIINTPCYICDRKECSCMEGDCKDGNGKMMIKIIYPNDNTIYKEIYIGKFINGNANGSGKLYYYFDDNNRNSMVLSYEGEFKNGLKHGNGSEFIIIVKKGLTKIFDGEFRYGVKHGYGTHYYSTPTYKGLYINGEMEGVHYKKYYIGKDSYICKSQYKNGKLNGNGIQIYYDYIRNRLYKVSKYEGYFQDNKKHGNGLLYEYFDNKFIKIYEGNWKDNKFDGKGIYYFLNGNVEYNGEWKNGEKDGLGISYQYISPGKRIKRYEGNWKNDLYNGNGTLYADNETIEYDGEWKNGIKHGQGKYYEDSNNPNIYIIGSFCNGDAVGGIFFKNGNVLKKIQCDNNICKGVMYHENYPDKIFFEGLFKDGYPYDGVRYNIYGKKIKGFLDSKFFDACINEYSYPHRKNKNYKAIKSLADLRLLIFVPDYNEYLIGNKLQDDTGVQTSIRQFNDCCPKTFKYYQMKNR